MDGNPNWQRVAAILDRALDVPEEARADYVREACGGDVDLLAEIVTLLAAHAHSAGFLEEPPPGLVDHTRSATLGGATAAGSARFATGQTVGRYRIERLLGRGGMGEVYAAEDIEHGRRVALKVLVDALTSRDDRARFLREGQLAAAVTHPNSVYVYGSEVVADVPIIVMELLPGGTLKDRVRDGGPLPAAEAATAILQVVAGLDAAFAGGILHRDIKPGNCFVDRDGTVKIGDFGLSIVTTRDLTYRTATGTLRVTPQFAAPEQLKGAEPDVAADIYGVGATLFFLLTGEPPFNESNLLTLLTRVVTEPPRSPRAIVATVPRGLAAVALRCLAKDPRARFKSYPALREALRPFAAGGPADVSIAGRFAANVVDHAALAILTLAVQVVRLATFGPTTSPGRGVTLAVAIMALYYFLTEWLGGGSPGKRLFGLRVTDTDGARPDAARVAARTAIFVTVSAVAYSVPGWIVAVIRSGPRPLDPAMVDAVLAGVGIGSLFVPLLLFVTARRDHEMAALHEILSGTRVRPALSVVRGAALPAPRQEALAAVAPDAVTGRRGPFVLQSALETAADVHIWRAFDPVLRRHVWVRDATPGTPKVAPARRDLARPARLRWLGGRRGPSDAWDAFEAPPGTALRVWAATPQPWSIVRQLLLDLAEELAASEVAGELPVLSLNQVWITSTGRAMLLDFPAPGRPSPADALSAAGAHSDAQRLLREVAWVSLAGGRPSPYPPLPPAGSALLHTLTDTPGIPVRKLLEECRGACAGDTRVPRWIRAAAPAAILIIAAVLITSIATADRGVRDPLLIGEGRNEQVLVNALARADALDRLGIDLADPERHALEVYLARRYAPLRERVASDPGLRQYLKLADTIAARHPASTDAELDAALAVLSRRQLDDMARLSPEVTRVRTASQAAVFIPPITVLLVTSLIFAFVLRGGLLLSLCGVIVVDDAGVPVRRVHALLRTAVAWSPVIALYALTDEIMSAVMRGAFNGWIALALGLVGVLVAGTIIASANPSRGLQERLTRTWLVKA